MNEQEPTTAMEAMLNQPSPTSHLFLRELAEKQKAAREEFFGKLLAMPPEGMKEKRKVSALATVLEYYGPPLPIGLLFRRMESKRDALFAIGEAFGDDEPIGEEGLREMGLIP